MTDKLKIKVSKEINIIGFILITIAGWVDTVGINLFLKESSAFMTGRSRFLGYWIFKGDLKAFIGIIIIVIAFIIGSFISTLITRKKGLTGGLIFTGILLTLAAFPIGIYKTGSVIIIIPMAMGCQNAATSLTPINRTTHLTGAATDIGINIAKKNWDVVKFWTLRWIGFPLGSIIGLNLVHMVNNNIINMSTTLFLPAIIVILVAVIQKLFFNIPLLEGEIVDTKEKELIEKISGN